MRCKAFGMENPKEARKHMQLEIIKNYGDHAYGHYLHAWDDGKRFLARCKTCGGYVLIQESEFHGEKDGYYTDYIPVSGEEEAEEINKKYSGFALELDSGIKYLIMDGWNCRWSK